MEGFRMTSFYYTPYALPPLMSAIVCGGLAIFALHRRRLPVAVAVFFATAGMAGWALAYALNISSTGLPLKILFAKAGASCAILSGVAMLVFAMEATGYGAWFTRRTLLYLCTFPAFSILLAWTVEFHSLHRHSFHLVESGPLLLLGYQSGPVFIIHYLYVTACMVVALSLFALALKRGPAESRPRFLVFLIVLIVPCVVENLNLTPIPGLSMVTSTFWLTGLGFTFAIARHRLLEVAPIARSILFDHLGEPVLVFDMEGELVECNQAARELFAREPSAVMQELAETAESRFPALKSLHEGDYGVLKEVMEDPEAVDRYWALHALPLRRGKRGLGMVVQLHDISAIKQAEQTIARACDAAEGANRGKSRFLSVVSHEMRTPLQAMMGAAELLADTSLDERQQRLVTLFGESCATLKQLIDDILDMSRIEAGKMEGTRETFNLPALMNHLQRLFEPQFARKGIEWSCKTTSGTPSLVTGNRRHLLQILMNLIGNAMKFTHHGAVAVIAAPVSADDPSILRFTVQDSGEGMPESFQVLAFESSSQAASEILHRMGGTGLGLAIARHLAQSMGGTIHLASEPMKGSTFTVIVPLEPAQAVTATEGPEAQGDQDAPKDLPPINILVVDDVPENREVFRYFLEGFPAQLAEASSGSEALVLFGAGRFDCVLLDMQMPEMDGVAVYRAIRAMEAERQGPPTPVIAVSAGAFADDIRYALEAGFTDYLTRPVGKKKLLETVCHHVRGAQTPAGEGARVDGGPSFGETHSARESSSAAEKDGETTDEAATDKGVEKALAEMMPKVIERLRVCAEEAVSAGAAGDFATAGRMGHTIEGLGMTFGLIQAERLGREMEVAARDGDMARLQYVNAEVGNWLQARKSFGTRNRSVSS